MNNKIALIDADSLLYIVCHNKKNSNQIKTFEDCKIQMDTLIKNILLATKANEYLLFLTIGKNFRYDIYPEYKANRKYNEKPEYFNDIRDYLKNNYQAVYEDKLEADDLLLIYKNHIINSFISSIDKDLMGLEGNHYNYNKLKWVDVSKEQANINFWSSMIVGKNCSL